MPGMYAYEKIYKKFAHHLPLVLGRESLPLNHCDSQHPLCLKNGQGLSLLGLLCLLSPLTTIMYPHQDFDYWYVEWVVLKERARHLCSSFLHPSLRLSPAMSHN